MDQACLDGEETTKRYKGTEPEKMMIYSVKERFVSFTGLWPAIGHLEEILYSTD
jgi:hypothetical protein